MNDERQQGFGVYGVKSGKAVRLAMQELWLTGTILSVGARLVARHVFRSGEDKPIEAIYAFGLPADAALRRFRVVGEGFDVASALKPVVAAREAYEEGIEQGSLSTLAQVYKDGLVNLNLGNIRPGETVTVLLELAAGVSHTDDGFRFKFPFTLAPGYHARAAAVESDSGEGEMALPEDVFGDVVLPRWRESAEGLHRVGFELDVLLSGADTELASPSHAVAVRMEAPNKAKVRLARESDLPNRDLILDAARARTTPEIFTGCDEQGKGRFAAVLPSHCFGQRDEDAPRDLLFLVDRSGSMDGRPFEQAQRALLACIAALTPEDRFGLIFFDHEAQVFQPRLVAADQEYRDQVREFIGAMKPRGGTEIAEAIRAAARVMPDGGDVMLLSDGQVFETGPLVALARKTGLRFHCLGIGSAGKDRFFTALARATDGTARSVTPREAVDGAALALFTCIAAPIARGLRWTVSGLPGAVLAPQPPAFVNAGQPVLLFGACDGDGAGMLECEWDGGRLDTEISVTGDRLGETLKLIQGARVTAALEMDQADPDESPQTAKRREERQEKRLVQLAEEYGLANPAMALVAVVKRAGDQPGELPKTSIVPVGMPEDMRFDAYFGVAMCYDHSSLLPQCAASENAREVNMMMSCESPRTAYRIEEARDLSEPAFIREKRASRRMKARGEKKAAVERATQRDDKIDILQLMGMLEADGGMPGEISELRIARTLAAAMQVAGLTLEQSSPGKRGGPGAWIQRMTTFLQQQKDHALSPERAAVMKRVYDALDRNDFAPPPGWTQQRPRDFFAMSVEELWKWIAAAVDVAESR